MDKENFRLNGWSKEERNRFELHMVNVYKKESILRAMRRIGPVDIIVEDGPHTSPSQLITLSALMPYLKPNGYFVIEDLHTTCPNDDSHSTKKFQKDSEITIQDYFRDCKNKIYKNYKYINNSDSISKLNLEIFFERGTKVTRKVPSHQKVFPSEIIFIKRKEKQVEKNNDKHTN